MMKFGLCLRISKEFFCSIHKVLENHDLGKCHKIWTKFHCPQFLADMPMVPLNNEHESLQVHHNELA